MRVLFVSKPIVPPWHDGSKNLVRDVARNLVRAKPTVMTTPMAPLDGVASEPVYEDAGRFAPAITANARVVRRLMLGDAQDIWHFVFAPNPVSSLAAIAAKRTRRALGWRGRVVQTVASAPRSFDGIDRWIFGDAVVALSEHTRGRLLGAGTKGRIDVIPPCAEAPTPPTAAQIRDARARYGLGEADAPLVVYPGDLEISRGASAVARAIAPITRAMPDARVVFACRAKTDRAAAAASSLQAELRAAGLLDRARFVGEIDDLPALLAAAGVVAFPVDDLYGKVDLPLVLLESLALGVPLVLARGGPLEAIASARFVDPADDAGLAAACLHLLRDRAASRAQADAGRALYESTFTPRVVAARYDALYDELFTSRKVRLRSP